ncbi:hypothetical protein D8770_25195 [Methylobacterium sp. DB1607]|nr:hypothetical protein [Methylobacterium sp. DB1607]
MAEIGVASNLTKEAVVEEIGRTTPGREAQVQVFLHRSVPPDQVARVARDLVDAARHEVSDATPVPVVGRTSKLAKSFALTADIGVLRALAACSDVEAILPDNLPDILIRPRPSTRRPEDW